MPTLRVFQINPEHKLADLYLYKDREKIRPEIYDCVLTLKLPEEDVKPTLDTLNNQNAFSIRHLEVSDILCLEVDTDIEDEEKALYNDIPKTWFIRKSSGWENIEINYYNESMLRKLGYCWRRFNYKLNKKQYSYHLRTYDYLDFFKSEGCYINEDDLEDFDSEIKIICSDRALDEAEPEARRPVYAVRGKPIPKEVALDLIYRFQHYPLDCYYGEWLADKFKAKGITFRDERFRSIYNPRLRYFELEWIPDRFSCSRGWCHPDGYIGTDFYFVEKNPGLDELVYEWLQIIDYCKYDLDIVVALTNIEELYPEKYKFIDKIDGGLRIKGKTIEVLGRAKARNLFKIYDKKYTVTTPYEHYVDAESKERHRVGVWERPCDNESDDRFRNTWSCPFYHEDEPKPIDKNDTRYYGVPDFTYQTTPLTLTDINNFIDRYIAEEPLREAQRQREHEKYLEYLAREEAKKAEANKEKE